MRRRKPRVSVWYDPDFNSFALTTILDSRLRVTRTPVYIGDLEQIGTHIGMVGRRQMTRWVFLGRL